MFSIASLPPACLRRENSGFFAVWRSAASPAS